MTGVADVYMMLRRPRSNETKARIAAMVNGRKKQDHQKFVVLSWKRTGSNLLCGILHNHPEILMHNELFNPIEIFTYHPDSLIIDSENQDKKWTFLGRDLWPSVFLEHIWTGRHVDGSKIKEKSKAIGFKSFPDHWTDSRNQDVWRDELLYNTTVKKIILIREDELAVYVSMKRAEETGSYMTRKYPKGLKIRIDIPKFQAFVNHYEYTFQRKYRSPLQTQDSFRISYEQIVDKENFERQVAPLLFKFLGVDHTIEPERLKEVVCQSGEEPLHNVISNFDEVEFAFRHTNLSYLRKIDSEPFLSSGMNPLDRTVKLGINQPVTASWSILLPICSRTVTQSLDKFNINKSNKNMCWKHLESFAESLLQTTTAENRARTECIVGIDLDDNLFNTPEAKQKIVIMLPCKVTFVTIHKPLYGKVCKIWNKLADQAKHDFIVLLGDDVVLMDEGWQDSIEAKFREIAELNSLPFGAASVAFNDLSFEGFPTFPVVHRWHFRTFNSVLPRQFINQGGDPYLFELYSRWNASAFVKGARVKNTLGWRWRCKICEA